MQFVKIMTTAVVVASLVSWSVPGFAGDCDNLKLCYKASLGKKGGKPCTWFISDKHPIPYYTNVSLLPAAKQAKALSAIKAAFDAYAKIPCTSLKFYHAGSHTSFSDVPGSILVYFGNTTLDKASWIYLNVAYHREMHINSYQTGEIDYGFIGFNAADYGWSVGGDEVAAPPSTAQGAVIDVQTAMMWLIPDLLGYQVNTDLSSTTQPIKYKTVLPSLCPEMIKGAQYSYFSKTSTTCTQPTGLLHCQNAFDPGDLGVIKDGWYTDMPARQDKGGAAKLDTGPKTGDGPTVDQPPAKKCTKQSDCASGEVCTIDGICQKTAEEDDGCSCRVNGGSPAQGALVLLILLGLLFVRRREL